MSTSVKYFAWDMPGAPTLNRAAGSLIDVMDACLVNGFGLRAVSTLSASGGVATATTAIAHGYEVDAVVRISGASPAGFNGDFRITAVTDTSFTFATVQPNGSASGTIEARIAPLGWERPFSATDIAVYRATDPESTRMFLRVEDTGVTAGNARWRGFEEMTGVNTGTNVFPSDAQVSAGTGGALGGGFIYKATTLNPSSARTWVLIGDSKTFYFWNGAAAESQGPALTTYGGSLHGFGDFSPRNPAYAFNCFVSAFTGNVELTGQFQVRLAGPSQNSFTPRDAQGFPGSNPMFARGVHPQGSSGSSANGGFRYPNPSDNALIIAPVGVMFDAGQNWAGSLRGLYWIANTIPSLWASPLFASRQKIDGLGGLSGSKFMSLRDGGGANAGSTACLIDLLGPWGD